MMPNTEPSAATARENRGTVNRSAAMSTKEPRYATVQHPMIQALIAGTYRYKTREQALKTLHHLRDRFIISRHQPQAADGASLIFWVKGYEISEEEAGKGWSGNYTLASIQRMESGEYALLATKLPAELKHHPQRNRPKGRHPDWGHPVLRAVRKGKVYPTVEAARNEFQVLHNDYPETTIPLTNRMFVMIYQRPKDPDWATADPATREAPVKKYILELQVAGDDGGYLIIAKENDQAPPVGIAKQQAEAEAGSGDITAKETAGKFTAMVALKKKKAKSPVKPTAAAGEASANAEGDASAGGDEDEE
jgi:hypothetical protein